MKTPEARTKHKVKAELNEMGAYHFWPVQTGYGAATLDCLAWFRSGMSVIVWGIECKREGVEKPTPRQAATMKQMRQAGAKTWIVTLEGTELKWIEIRD